MTNCPYCGQATYQDGRCTSCGAGMRLPVVVQMPPPRPSPRWTPHRIVFVVCLVLTLPLMWFTSGGEDVPIDEHHGRSAEQVEPAVSPSGSLVAAPAQELADELEAIAPWVIGAGLLAMGAFCLLTGESLAVLVPLAVSSLVALAVISNADQIVALMVGP